MQNRRVISSVVTLLLLNLANVSLLKAQSPSTVSVTSNGSGGGSTFTVTVTDPDGQSDIASIDLLINSSLTFTQGCSVYLNRTTSAMSVWSDATNGVWLGPLSLGVNQALDGNCVAYAGPSTVQGNGTLLTWSVPVSFKAQASDTIWVQVTDYEGHASVYQTMGPYTITATPDPAFVLPATGSGWNSLAFNATYAHPNGTNFVQWVQLLVDATSTGSPYCFVHYDRVGNGLWLYGDDGIFHGPVTPGASSTLQTAECTLNAQTTSVLSSSYYFQVTFAITFHSPLNGSKNVFMREWDEASHDSGWQQKGSWTVNAPAPLTLTSLKGVNYFPRGHAWWSMLYDWYGTDCSTTTLPQSECLSQHPLNPNEHVFEVVQNDLAALAANGVNFIHLYLWDQDIVQDSLYNSGGLGPLVGANSPLPGFTGWDDGGPSTSPNGQWTALQSFLSMAASNSISVSLHFAVHRPSKKVLTDGYSTTGTNYASWVAAFIAAVSQNHNVLIWGLNYGIPEPVSDWQQFWQSAYPTILSSVEQNAYPSGRALTMVESGFGAVWPPCPNRGDVQPILSLQQWTYPGTGNSCTDTGNSWYTAIGYQWNWRESPNPDQQSVGETVSLWQQALAQFQISPDLWAIQAYNASAADLEAALECVAGVANAVCPSPPTQGTIPFSHMIVTEVATGSSFEQPPIGNGAAYYGDQQTPTTSASGQAQWLTNSLCALSRHGIPAFAWFGLYDSNSWWETNFTGDRRLDFAHLAWLGYFGLSSEYSSPGNKPAWTAFLNYPGNCPSADLPAAPVLALYADASYYTQGDIGIINYTAANVSSLSLNETPSSGIFSCQTSHQIQASSTPLVGTCAAVNVTMTNQQITLSGSNKDVDGSQSGNTSSDSASISVMVGSTPMITSIQNWTTGQTCNVEQNPSCTINAGQQDIIVIYGKGFSILPGGGNTVHLMGAGDAWLYETDGYYYWDGSRTQINAQIGCYVGPGSYTMNAYNPHNNVSPSPSYSINITSSSSCQ